MKNKLFKKAIATLLTVATVVGIFGGTQVQAATKKQIRHHGTIQGVEYKAISDNNYSSVSIAFRNSNKYPVLVEGQVSFYSKSGKKLPLTEGGWDERIYVYLYPNQRLTQGAGGSDYYSNYKVNYKVTKVTNKEIKKETDRQNNRDLYYYHDELQNINFKDLDYTDGRYATIGYNGKKFYSPNKIFYINGFRVDKATKTIAFTIIYAKDAHQYKGTGSHSVKFNFYDKAGYPIGFSHVDSPYARVFKGDDIYYESDEIENFDKIDSVDIYFNSSNLRESSK